MNDSKPEIKTEIGGTTIPVVACGSGWLVVDKPCGMSIHNDPGNDLCAAVLSLVQAGRIPAMDRTITGIHAVHRIDRDTSGIVLLAGGSMLLHFFGAQFASNTVKKRYLALVHGRLVEPEDCTSGCAWNWSLTPMPMGRNDPRGRGKRVPCITRWQVLRHAARYTLIECEPVTGRRHQIRRHAKLAGHPVVGDRRYGSVRSVNYLSRHHGFNRLGLHAHALTIRLPGETATTTISSSGMPEKMRQLLEADG